MAKERSRSDGEADKAEQEQEIEEQGNGQEAEQAGRKSKRVLRPFPASTFEEALEIPVGIHRAAPGQGKIRRLTLFDFLNKSPDSGPSRQLIANASRYGLIKGSRTSEYLELTPDGSVASNPESPPRDKLRAGFRLAVERISPFQTLYERLKGSRVPSQAVMRDILVEAGVSTDDADVGVDTFILNAKFLGLLQTIAGAERLLSLEHTAEQLSASIPSTAAVVQEVEQEHTPSPSTPPPQSIRQVESGWEQTCFYITPIGEEGSEQRMHSDLFLNYLVEPAMERFKFKVVRADHIGKPGMITAQVIQHVLNSRLVVADLSFHNPNVFYELSLRHATGLPVVQVIRKGERIPFDLDQFRTIQIDNSSIYSLVPHLETYRSEIANQARRVLESSDPIDNPLTIFCPGLKLSVGIGA